MNVAEHLPLFDDEPEPVVPPVDPEERLEWARRALLLSNLDTLTAESVREFVMEMRPELIGSGRWLGFVFRCSWFTMIRPEQATRPEARARWLWSYKLSDAGIRERQRLQEAIHVNSR